MKNEKKLINKWIRKKTQKNPQCPFFGANIGWLINWLIGLLIHWFIDPLIDWLIQSLITWLIEHLIDWLLDWLIDWFIDLPLGTAKFSCMSLICTAKNNVACSGYRYWTED